MTNLVCAGFGGQGVLTAGLIIAKTAMDNDKHVTWMPSYGSEMRGGTANCNVKISDDEIASPFIKNIDILMALNSPSVSKFQHQLVPGGILLINSSIIKEVEFRKDIHVYAIEATRISTECQNARGTNITMIGALIGATKLFDRDIMEKGIDDFFASKGKNNPHNAACFRAGVAKVTSLQTAAAQ